MAESTRRWRSSLANIESRLRRSLGLAGPIGLELTDPLPLLPVTIADDAMRPGASSQGYRNRRFSHSFVQTFTAGAPLQSQSFLSRAPDGLILDWLEISLDSAAAADIYDLRLTWSTPVQVAAGAPGYAVVTQAGWFVDPQNSATDFTPAFAGSGAVGPANQPVWDGKIGLGTIYRIKLDFWLPNGHMLSFGNSVNAPQAYTMATVWRGRIF